MPFDHNDHYHRLLLRHVPAGSRRALDVGCGTGAFARLLAEEGIATDAVDASEEAIEAAVAASPQAAEGGPRFRHEDIARVQLPPEHYDFIACLASVHHMPFETVAALRDALAPGGTLVVLACYRPRSAVDHAWSLAALPVNAAVRAAVALRERATGTAPAADRVRPPVAQPGMTLAEIRRETERLLPGSSVRRLLFWRCLLVHRA